MGRFWLWRVDPENPAFRRLLAVDFS